MEKSQLFLPSGAPFPKASKVNPASAGESFSSFDKADIDGTKYLSAMNPKSEIKNTKKINNYQK